MLVVFLNPMNNNRLAVLFVSLLSFVGQTSVQGQNLAVSIQVQNHPTCFQPTGGQLSASAIGGTAPYSFQWFPGGVSGAAVLNLGQGTYRVRVTDAVGDTASSSLYLTKTSGIQIQLTQSQSVLCYGGNTGSLTALATGTASSFSYRWKTTPAQTTAQANNLYAGTYWVVASAQGCKDSAQFTVSQPAGILGISATLTAHPVCQNSTDGVGYAQVFGGTPPYQVVWSNGVTNDTNLALYPGTVVAFVVDANACTGMSNLLSPVATDFDCDSIPNTIDGTDDPDGDGLPNFQDEDSDGDGILDRVERTADPDQDGLGNWLDLDSDGDGLTDRWEGTADLDNDGVANFLDLDSDGDGWLDQLEGSQDCDNNALPNAWDPNPCGLVVRELITPNGDGANDFWVVENLLYAPQNRVALYDRWGELVFRTENYENDFDALDLPLGVYYYVVQDLSHQVNHSGYVWISR